MAYFFNTSDINQTFIIEPMYITGNTPSISACTFVYTNALASCSGNTSISMGTGVISFNGDLYTNNNLTANEISGTTFYSGGTNLSNIINANNISGGTFDNTLFELTLHKNDGDDVVVTGFTDYYITGLTFDSNYLTINRNDGVSISGLIDNFTGLTVNGSLSATNISGTSISSENISSENISGTSISGITFFGDGSNLTGISTQDTVVTGGTYTNGTALFTNNTGGTFSVTGFTTGTTLFFNTYDDFPLNGDDGRIYVDDTNNIAYLWNVSANTYTNIGGENTPVQPDIAPITFAQAATIGVLSFNPIYYNGPANDGVGATLSATSFGVLRDASGVGRIDYSYVPVLGDTILVRAQLSTTNPATNKAFQNGLYTITNTGSLTSNYVLTRTADFDSATELYPVQVNILVGSTYTLKFFLQTTTNPIIGVSNLVFGISSNQSFSTQIGFVDTASSSPLTGYTYISGTTFSTLPGNGAVLSAQTNGYLGSINGLSATTSSTIVGGFTRVLLKDQINPAHNGDYQVINAGSTSTKWVLRRINGVSGGFDRYARFFIVSNNGSTKAGKYYFTTPNNPPLTNAMIGSAPINIVEYGGSSSGASGTFTGGTVSGPTNFTSGLTANTISANTISATTYSNLPTDVRVTGGTFSAGAALFTNNTGGTFSVTGFTTGGTTSLVNNVTPITSGASNQILFQSTGGTLSQSSSLSWSDVNKRLTVKTIGTNTTDIPFNIRNAADTSNLFSVNGRGNAIFNFDSTDTDYISIDAQNQDISSRAYGGLKIMSLNPSNGFVGFGVNGYKFGIGTNSPQARLDIRAQGALSTDIALRVRNNADTANLIDIAGNGAMNFTSTSGVITFTEGSSGGSGQGIIFKRQSNIATFSLDNGSTLNLTTGGFNCVSPIGSIVLNGGTSSGAFFQSIDLRGNGNQSARVNSSGQFVFTSSVSWYNGDGGYTYADRVIVDRQSMAFRNATTSATSSLDSFKIYSADIVAGNAAPHFRTENGSIIKLYQETTGVTQSTLVTTIGTPLTDTDTFDGYTLKQVVKALRNLGILQ